MFGPRPVGSVWQVPQAKAPASRSVGGRYSPRAAWAFPLGRGVPAGEKRPGLKWSGSGRSVGRLLSGPRNGFGGNATVARKASNSSMSAGVGGASSPWRSTKARAKSCRLSLSPRQCRGSLPMMSCRVCVVIGPFMGWKSSKPTLSPGIPIPRLSPLSGSMGSAGSPRSQASRSVRESTWQDAHETWPSPEVAWVS